MPEVLTLQGIRGGVGTSTLTAGLGYALNRLGERVLLVDMCPDNLLGLHYNLPVAEPGGWAQAEATDANWREAAFAIDDGLVVLPYGALPEERVLQLDARLQAAPELWQGRLGGLAPRFDWILFDLPQRLPGHVGAATHSTSEPLSLRVMNVDAGCHVLLQRALGTAAPAFYLANRHDPAVQLQRDLVQLWAAQCGEHWVARTVHEDAAMAESLAMKAPVGRHRPDALASADLDSLAIWCLAQAGRAEAR